MGAETAELYVGLDVGGTTVKEGLFTREGELLGKLSVPTPPLVDDAGYAAVSDGIDRLLAEAGAMPDAVRGIGLAVPCPIPAEGDAKVKANIDINLPGLGAAVGERFPRAAVRFENDANAAAMGELWAGAARGRRSFVFVTIGTGVGGGVVVDGGVVSGVAGAGGEIGHMCLNPREERACGCGGHGHLEQYSSATGVVTAYRDACARHGVEPIELSGPSDSKSVFQACREGDAIAWEAVDTMTSYLGWALALIADVVDPESFVLGGGASASADVYLPKLTESYRARALPVCADTPIEIASLGNDAGIFGAAYVALKAAAA